MYGQLITGAPGAGKTTYCKAMMEYLAPREPIYVNLDPAAAAFFEDHETHASGGAKDSTLMHYSRHVDIKELIDLKDVSHLMKLGPNGGILYVFEVLDMNIDWLIERLQQFPEPAYFLFDCPGQVELFTHHISLSSILEKLTKKLHIKLTSVYLVDFSLVCDDYSRLVAATLLALSSMLRLNLPHVNLLSKVDLVSNEREGNWEEILEDCRASSLSHYPNHPRYAKLHEGIQNIVEDYSLVGFVGFSVKDQETMSEAISFIDRACGYVFRPKQQGLS